MTYIVLCEEAAWEPFECLIDSAEYTYFKDQYGRSNWFSAFKLYGHTFIRLNASDYDLWRDAEANKLNVFVHNEDNFTYFKFINTENNTDTEPIFASYVNYDVYQNRFNGSLQTRIVDPLLGDAVSFCPNTIENINSFPYNNLNFPDLSSFKLPDPPSFKLPDEVVNSIRQSIQEMQEDRFSPDDALIALLRDIWRYRLEQNRKTGKTINFVDKYFADFESGSLNGEEDLAKILEELAGVEHKEGLYTTEELIKLIEAAFDEHPENHKERDKTPQDVAKQWAKLYEALIDRDKLAEEEKTIDPADTRRLEEYKERVKANRALLNSKINYLIHIRTNPVPGFVIFLIDHCIQEMDTPENRERYLRRPDKDFTRNRIYNFRNAIYYELQLGGDTLNGENVNFFAGTSSQIPTESGTSQALDKFKPEAFKDLFHRTAAWFNKILSFVLYDGMSIYAGDGTDVNIPKDKNDADTYIEPKKGSHNGYNQNHITACENTGTGIIIGAEVDGKRKSNETRAVTNILDETEFDRSSLLTLDRGIPSLSLIGTVILKENLDYLFRTTKHFIKELKDYPDEEEFDKDLRVIIAFSQADANKKQEECDRWNKEHPERPARIHIVSGPSKIEGKEKKSQNWFHNYDEIPYLDVRFVRFKIGVDKKGRAIWETVVTSLDRERYPSEKLKELYHLRWGIESSFRTLKYDMCFSVLHGLKKERILQEYYAKLTTYNICRFLIVFAEMEYQATLADTDQKRFGKPPKLDDDKNNNSSNSNKGKKRYEQENKLEYQINRSKACNLVIKMLSAQGDIVVDIIYEMTKRRDAVRPSREFARNLKRRRCFIWMQYRH